MSTDKKINKLRELMAERGISVYLIFTEDYHASEYVGDYFKEREYMSGFTGSAGTLVVTADSAKLWTDGRYFIQAEDQLSGTCIDLMKIGEPGVPEIIPYINSVYEEYNRNNPLYYYAYDKVTGERVYKIYELSDEYDDNICDTRCFKVAFDGRTVSAHFAEKLMDMLIKNMKHTGLMFELAYDMDLVDIIWKDRPKMSAKDVWELGLKYTGKSRDEKIALIRNKMKAEGAGYYISTALDEIAYLLNLRGDDVECNPVFLSNLIVTEDKVMIFANKQIFSREILSELAKSGVTVYEYDSFYKNLEALGEKKKVLLNRKNVNYTLIRTLPPGADIIDRPSPIAMMKAVKTQAEYENERIAHIKDGVAVTKFIYYLKKNVKKDDVVITEISAANILEQFRKESDTYLGPSFTPIIAYGPHGAIVHYEATKNSDVRLMPKSFVLCDTGGHYLEGTTDITRTITLGELTEEEKRAYTLVLMGHLNLANARFIYGTRGENLDYIAREPLWQHGLDYKHGTGHGVGYLLNVHEGPNRISHKINPGSESAVLAEGMITSCEPGLYIEGKFGIRHENLILCHAGDTNEYGKFMYFENLTMVPFDIEAIDVKLMSDKQVELLNSYHRMVYENISEYLNEEECKWLYEATKPICK